MRKETRKKHYFPAAVIVLTAACAAFILVMIFLRPHAAKPEDKRNKTEYVTEIDGYEMADLSMYGNLRVYDLLDANGLPIMRVPAITVHTATMLKIFGT